MGRWLITVATAVLVSCGSSSSSPTYNGGINGTPPSGTGSFVFTPADGASMVAGPTTCTIQSTTAHVAGLLLGFSSYSGICGFIRDHGIQCADSGKASATVVGVAILKAGLNSVTPVAPGTYTLNTTQGSAQTELIETEGNMSVTNATCGSSGLPILPDGTITITSASAAGVTGRVDLTWTNGGFSGPFDVAGCTANVDVCGFISTGPVCSGCF